MKIAVFSGSFDPLHIGHLAIMERLTVDGLFDRVYLVISPQNPWKSADNVLTARDRYEAAVAAVQRHPGLQVDVEDIELGMEPPHYTIRTLDALREREPRNRFTLVIGADNLARITQWREAERVLTEYGVCVYPRAGFDMAQIRRELHRENRRYKIRLIDAPMVDISSTQIRQARAQGIDMSEYLM